MMQVNSLNIAFLSKMLHQGVCNGILLYPQVLKVKTGQQFVQVKSQSKSLLKRHC